MIRSFKILCLTVAMGLAIGASTAVATPVFTSVPGSSQHLVAIDTGAADELTLGESAITCEGESYTAQLPSGQSSQLAFTPDWTVCKTTGAQFYNVTITHNGCNLEFSSTGPVFITCGISKKIELHHFTSSPHGSSTCTTTIGSQTATGNATYTNAMGDVEVHGTADIKVESHGACSLGFTLTQNATVHYSDLVFSTSDDGIHVK